ncbi:MAG: intradiol ring-cleavage dioxygenase [Planctomycetes bacterium]|nr:intradiol ring-cleavage dioxygenase [Planctomycetota bacterium]
MSEQTSHFTRRHFLGTAAFGSLALGAGGAFAEELARTPPQGEGPFYPDRLPLDTDNDLIVINDHMTPAVGEITHLSGRILDEGGEPIRGALVEIWQCDNNGAYLHTGSVNRDKRDGNFQGFGRFLTGSSGQYYFRTIKPVRYPGRAPHIHFMVKLKGQDNFTTQCYIKGDPQNERDFIFRTLPDAKSKDLLCVDFQPIKASKIRELAANFDIVLGHTPEQG